MKTANKVELNNLRRSALANAKKIFFNGDAATWSEALVLGWKAAKLKLAITIGNAIIFVKVKDGSLRTVSNPAFFVRTAPAKKTNRKANFQTFTFVDLDKQAKTGFGVVSCRLDSVLF